MSETANKPINIQILLFGSSRDQMDTVEASLRNVGLAVHCDQATNIEILESKITSKVFDLLLCRAFDIGVDIRSTIEMLKKYELDLPVLALFVEQSNPKELFQLMRIGVRDFVRENNIEHLQLVIARELSDLQQRRELAELKRKLQVSEQRSLDLVTGSREAIVFFQDGMHVQVNPAYLQLLGFKDQEEVEALPLLDIVDKNYHKALRAAIKALETAPDRGPSTLEIAFKHQNGTNLILNVVINRVELDGEWCIQMAIRSNAPSVNKPVELKPPISKPVEVIPSSNKTAATAKNDSTVIAPQPSAPITNVIPVVTDRSSEHTRILELIDRALSHNRFNLVYSSIVNLHGGGTRENYAVGVRLCDERNQEILPEVFLDIARRYEKINKIDRWVIRHTIAALNAQRQNGRRTGAFIPLSDVSAMDKNLLLWVVECLREYEARGGWLVFQIGEKYVRENVQITAKLFEGLRTMKCQIALDQFGLLPNPENLLNQLDVDYVKLAPSLVHNLHVDQNKQDALAQLNDMLQRHNVKTIAMAVEDGNALSILWNLGVTYIQGNFAQEPSANIEITN